MSTSDPGVEAEVEQRIKRALEQPQREPSPGERLGQYRLLERIGKGHFAWVWKAHDGNKDVAVKIFCVDRFNDDPTRLAAAIRLWRGALAMSKLGNSAHIVPVIGEPQVTGARIWFAMEYFPDRDLSTAINAQLLTEKELLSIVDQLLASIEMAHSHDIIHRDVKPENVLWVRRPNQVEARLTDFDIAYYEHFFSSHGSTAMSPGVAHYLPPDISFADPSEVRALMRRKSNDLYGLCVVILKMFAGMLVKVPAGKTPAQILKVLPPTKPTKPGGRSITGATRRRIAAVCSRGLQPEESNRFETIAEMRQAWTQPRSPSLVSAVTAATIAFAVLSAAFFATDLQYHRVPSSSLFRILFDTGTYALTMLGVTVAALVAGLKRAWPAIEQCEAWLAESPVRRTLGIVLAISLSASSAWGTRIVSRMRQHQVTLLESGDCWPVGDTSHLLRKGELIGPEVTDVICHKNTHSRFEAMSWIGYVLGIRETPQTKEEIELERKRQELERRAQERESELQAKDRELAEKQREIADKQRDLDAAKQQAGAKPGSTARQAVRKADEELQALKSERDAAQAEADRLRRGPAPGGMVVRTEGKCKAVNLTHPQTEYDLAIVGRLTNLCQIQRVGRVTIGGYSATCACD